jgi:hypothetical protein
MLCIELVDEREKLQLGETLASGPLEEPGHTARSRDLADRSEGLPIQRGGDALHIRLILRIILGRVRD